MLLYVGSLSPGNDAETTMQLAWSVSIDILHYVTSF